MFGASAGSDRFSVTLRSLTVPDVLQSALQLAARQLADPTFASEVWSTERARFIAAIKEANSQPGTQAQRAYARAVYGTHPYWYEPDDTSLQAITPHDLRQFHDRYLTACRARVSIVGALNRAQAEAAVERLLSLLPSGGGCEALPGVSDVQPLQAATERIIALNSAQAHVLMGQPGIARSDPEIGRAHV